LKTPTIENIKLPVQNELDKFQEIFESVIQSDAPLLTRVLRYMIKNKGKQLRPVFVFLSAKAAHGFVHPKAHVGASLVELLHSATLIHDDVVDGADFRRRMFSVPALWKSKVSVLVGDYLLGAGLKLAVENEAYAMLKELSLAVEEISKGELIQLERTRTEVYDQQIYFNVIQKKTAALLAAACAIGVHSSPLENTLEIRNSLYEYGLQLGMAFQIKDDLFDYGEAEVGKPRGNDLREGKKTLPLILAYQSASEKDRRWLNRQARLARRQRVSRTKVIRFVRESGAVEESEKIMLQYAELAKGHLRTLSPGPAVDSLQHLVDYSMTRKL